MMQILITDINCIIDSECQQASTIALIDYNTVDICDSSVMTIFIITDSHQSVMDL